MTTFSRGPAEAEFMPLSPASLFWPPPSRTRSGQTRRFNSVALIPHRPHERAREAGERRAVAAAQLQIGQLNTENECNERAGGKLRRHRAARQAGDAGAMA